MKIATLANKKNSYGNKIEDRADNALENLGHEVVSFDETEENVTQKILDSGADMFLFYKGGVDGGVIDAEDFQRLLTDFKGYKICIYWDKVYMGRQNFIHRIAPLTDLIFLTDGDFINAHNYINIYKLHPITDVDKRNANGSIKKEFQIPIVFPGQVYGSRDVFVQLLKERYGENFQQVFGIFDDDFTDLCESAKIIVSPLFPQTDLYWSNRVYKVISRGGFLIMPRLEGLTWEFEEGKHIEYYRSFEELCEKINYYLEHEDERDKIRKAGQRYCLENYTFEKSFKKMFDLL